MLLVGDVVGHGLQAARRAAFVRTTFAATAPFSDDPSQLLSWANTAVIERAGAGTEFVTAACVNGCVERSQGSTVGAGVLLYTDGLTEARHDGELFGLDRVSAALTGLRRPSPGEAVAVLRSRAADFAYGTLTDDLCLLAAPSRAATSAAAVASWAGERAAKPPAQLLAGWAEAVARDAAGTAGLDRLAQCR